MYSPDPSDDWWGVSTTATTRSAPAPTSSAIPSSMVGAVCLAPYRTVYSPGETVSRAPATPSTWARVRSANGEVPPMASYRPTSSASSSGVGERPRLIDV